MGLNRKVNNDVAVRLADTRSAADTRRILETELGRGGLRAPSTFYGVGIDPLTGQGLLHGSSDQAAQGHADPGSDRRRRR